MVYDNTPQTNNIQVDTNDLNVYSKLGEYSEKNVIEENGVYYFKNGFAHLYSDNLRISDHPKTGLPNKNFRISFDFKTQQANAPLFSMDAINGKGGHDRHMNLEDGIMMVRVWPYGTFKVSDQKLNDGNWHQMILTCEDD